MLILASQSPRRAELLEQVGIGFEAVPADVDERVLPDESAADYVKRVAKAKAAVVRAQYPDRPVLGSDTAVVLEHRILGKPCDRRDGIEMLLSLSGRTHQVMTGVALAAEQPQYALSTSNVRFRTLSKSEAESYWATGEPADKAGAYAVQGFAAAFIERIEGSYSGIMGLPLFETLRILHNIGLHSRVNS